MREGGLIMSVNSRNDISNELNLYKNFVKQAGLEVEFRKFKRDVEEHLKNDKEDIETLSIQLDEKLKQLDEYVSDNRNNCLSDAAMQLRKEIYALQNKIEQKKIYMDYEMK